MKSKCPATEKLRSYVQGSIPAGEALNLEQHLSVCSDCFRTIETLECEADDFFALLRKSVQSGTSPVLDEHQYQAAVKHICNHPRDSGTTEKTPPKSDNASLIKSLGEYDLLAEIGRGSMGVLYHAIHRRLRREVAVKVLKRVDTPQFVRRAHREMKAAGRVNDLHVVATTDAGECDGRFFLVMEVIDGVNLSRLVSKTGPLSVRDACEVICQASQGLAAIHQQHLVHRDIKPGNLMLDRDGLVKILDLGLALITKDGSDSGSQLTPSGVVMGSFNYIAPEQIDDAHSVDFKADIYGLGATFYTLLAGRPPFEREGAGRLERLLAASLGQCPAIETVRDDIPPEVATAVSGMMNVDPHQRLVDTQKVRNLLQVFRHEADLVRLMKSTAL